MSKALFRAVSKRAEYVFIAFVLIAGVCMSVPDLLTVPRTGDGDAYFRALVAYQNHTERTWFGLSRIVGSWLPLQAVLLGSVFRVIPDPQTAPRIFSLVFSVASVLVMYAWAKQVFRELVGSPQYRLLAAAAATAYLLFPFRIAYATIPFSEIPASFFLLVVCYLTSLRRIPYAALLSVMFLAQGIRYDFWFMVPLLWWRMYLDRRRGGFGFWCVAVGFVVFPLLWMGINHAVSGNALLFVETKLRIARSISPEVAPFDPVMSVRAWVADITEVVGAGSIIAAIVGAVLMLYRGNARTLMAGVLPVFFFVLLVVQVFFGFVEWMPYRYTYAVVTSMIPAVIYGYYRMILRVLRAGQTAALIGILSLAAVFIYDAVRIRSTDYMMKPSNDYIVGAYHVAEFVRPFAVSRSVYYDLKDPNDWFYPAISFFLLPERLVLLEPDYVGERKPQSGDIIVSAVASAENESIYPLYTVYADPWFTAGRLR